MKSIQPVASQLLPRLQWKLLLLIFLVVLSLAVGAADQPPGIDGSKSPKPDSRLSKKNPISWDAMEKTVATKPGEDKADFVFTATNTSDQAIMIDDVKPSCLCTITDMPEKPWVLAPGGSDALHATVDVVGKTGVLTKTLLINSAVGLQTLILRVKIAPMDEVSREGNQKLALADRRAVFRGDCASCHVAPAVGKKGAELFKAACAICHASENRASMVPNLWVAREKRDEAYWSKWIIEGKEGTLMPAFAEEKGGPLSKEQVESLISYVLAVLPTEPRVKEGTPSK